MIYYLNQGFIAEQALCSILRRYFDQLHLDNVYTNFHVEITNDHPFAHLIYHDESTNTADSFPSIVVTTTRESKVPEMSGLPPQFEGVALTENDLTELIENTRKKTRINDAGEEITVTNKKGVVQYEQIPGYSIVTNDETIEKLKALANTNGYVYGVRCITRKRDSISIEIWAENNQLKNELYEQLRLLLSTNIDNLLQKNYAAFGPVIFDNSISGERSNNFNVDFDLMLYGSHISFDLDYNVAQTIIDTEITNINKDIIPEVINHVYNS